MASVNGKRLDELLEILAWDFSCNLCPVGPDKCDTLQLRCPSVLKQWLAEEED